MRGALLFLLWPMAAAADLSGLVRIIDGDTLVLGGETLRLFGIDAPEIDQTCPGADGAPWPCGVWAAEAAADMIGGRPLTCTARDTDRYGRTIAHCLLEGQDLGAAMVAAGIATAYRAYSWDYDLEEKAAQVTGLGIWAGGLQAPAAFRSEAPQVPPGDCVIKGNISASGRIYHSPGQEHYDDTRISLEAGERWFCTPAEAEAAGWRPARR